MKLLYIITALLSFGINDIAKVNQLKIDAQNAYEEGNYETALEIYQTLTDSLEITSDEILMNMGHAYYHLSDTANARYNYQKLSDIENNKIKSVALQQLGVISNSPGNEKLALNYFKEALKADPTNEEARYNYELLKKKIKEKEEQDKKDQQKQDQNKDEENKDNKDKENKDKDEEKEQKSKEDKEDKGEEEKKEEDQKGKEQKDQEKKEGEQQEGEENKEEKKDGEEKEGEPKDGEEKEQEEKDGKPKEGEEEGEESKNKPKSLEQKLKENNLSPQQAKMILDALRSQEIQYLQQQRRKSTKKKKSGKPDW